MVGWPGALLCLLFTPGPMLTSSLCLKPRGHGDRVERENIAQQVQALKPSTHFTSTRIPLANAGTNPVSKEVGLSCVPGRGEKL